MALLNTVKQAWQDRKTIGDGAKEQELVAFLPAALEIQQTPPNPLARKLNWALICLFTLVVVWACFGEINIVASAEGKIIPSSRVKQIQPLTKAVVKSILVQEGQYVEQGQPLIELDKTLTSADESKLSAELSDSELKLSSTQALLNQLNKPFIEQSASFVTADETEQYSLLSKQQWQQYRSQRQGLQSALRKNLAQQQAAQASVKKLEQTLPIITKRTEIAKQLLSNNYVAEMEYLELKQQLIQQQQDLIAEQQRYKQLQAAQTELEQQTSTFVAQTKAQYLLEVTELNRQITGLKQELAKAQDLNAKQVLYAPVAGQVQQLAISTVGGVVTEAQELMLIVPTEEQLEVEVHLENKDIGFVLEGMAAEIKIHTFPFTKYGVINGQVNSISDDAIVDEQRGLVYTMQLAMFNNTIMAEGREVKLIPGMAVTAEVQTGKRRIIEFFLAPLLRHKQESLQER